MQLPRVRTGLLRHNLDNQVLIYDSANERVHLLDPTTACVMQLLEEGWTTEGIAVEAASRLQATPIDGFLPLAIEELRVAGLLVEPVTVSSIPVDVTRRELMRKAAVVGATALLVPAIMTLTASPGYAAGTNTVAQCGVCTATLQCQGGLTCDPASVGPSVCGGGGKRAAGVTCTGNGQCCSGTCTGAGTCA